MVIYSRPPAHVWDRATTLLGATETTIFTYAPDIYVPSGEFLSAPLYSHELVHLEQQGTSPDVWWERYFVDVEFRVEQEIPAYRKQYQKFCFAQKDRNARARFAAAIASDMAGPLYGKVMDFTKAYKLISG